MRASDIDHGAPEHLYQQLAEILRHQITSGHLQGKIPSAITLAADYGVAVLTARAAVMLLRDEGLVTVVTGRGTFVVAPGDRQQRG
jgi:GntR family transcriptional regulator